MAFGDMDGKSILDCCCGSKMFYYEKNSPHVLYLDNRKCEETMQDGRKVEISPDIVADFTQLPFPDKSFTAVIFDPPHMKRAGARSWLAQKYGVLPKDWEQYIGKAFSECFRVLSDGGVLIFKWSCYQIAFSEVIKLSPVPPLLGDKKGKTRWTVFVK